MGKINVSGVSSILVFLLLISISFNAQAQVSPKRGMAYGYHSVADLNAVAPGVSWWYNWSSAPDAGVASYYSSLGVEFVPMFWNNNFNVADAIANIPAGAKYILAYNEPNFNVEANMTPAQAAAAWYKIEQVATARNLEIISAAAAYCGGSVCVAGYTDPVVWHNDFFAACPTCRVDYIAFHNYEPTVGALVALTNNLKVFNRPIWVTEFAYWDPAASSAAKRTYLQNAVSAFENDPDIFRYSWFAGRSSANPSIAILGADGVLTTLGSDYINATYPKSNVPGKIECEDVYRRRETDLQACTDVGGGQNVGWTDAGTWNEYLVNVSTTGSYTFRFRVASGVSTGRFDIEVDGVTVRSNVAVASTGGWQTWVDLDVTGLVLSSGQHLIKFKFTNTGTNMNYFTTIFESTVPPAVDFSASTVSTCIGNPVVFTDLTANKIGSETFAWNFGAGASPATAATVGPHTVSYSTGGMKTVSLTVANANGTNTNTKTNYITVASPPSGCLFSDDFANSTVNWITPIPGAFTHTESGTNWTISNAGYGEWENFSYTLNNGTIAAPLNFQCAAHKPIVKIRAKASANCLLSMTMVDGNGRAIDNYTNCNLELTTAYQTFSVNYATRFRNYYSASPGVVDSSNINRLQFAVNPAYFSFPYTGVNATYNAAFAGTVDIEWIGIGDNSCSVLPVELISFEATRTGSNAALLKWSTASESNNSHFELFRSTDGNRFISIGNIEGAGTSILQNDYSFLDEGLSGNLYYYYLKQVDYDGTSSPSSVKSVRLKDNIAIDVVPTVVANGSSVKIVNSSHAEMLHISLIDLNGKVYTEYNHVSDSVKEIATSDLSAGVYMLRIVFGNEVVTKKIIVY